jgi:hypothetical protein
MKGARLMEHLLRPEHGTCLRATLGDYHRTAIRHRLARATVIVLDKADTEYLIAAATFRETESAARFAETATLADTRNVVVLLNQLGETIAVSSNPPTPTSAAARTAEWMWRGSAPIPKPKTKTTQPQLPLPQSNQSEPQRPNDREPEPTPSPAEPPRQ